MSASHQDASRVSEQDILRFLQQHPDFFQSNPELLADITLQHDSGKAVSLIERQVAVLRDQRKKLKRQLQDLVDIARANDELDRRLHQLTLRLIDCRRFADVLEMLKHYLQRDFAADAVTLRLRVIPQRPDLAGHVEFTPNFDAGLAPFMRIIQEQKPVCGRFKVEDLKSLFPASGGAIASAALIPLYDLPVNGVLAVGSTDVHRFHADHGTVFLSQLGELVSRALRVCLLP